MIQSYQLPDNPIHIKLYIFTNEKVQRNPPPLKKKAGMQGPLPVSSLCVNNSSANLSTQISSTIQGFFFHPYYPNQPTSSRAIVVEALVDLVVRWQRELMGCLRSY